MELDVSALSTVMKQYSLAQKVSVAVTKKVMDAADQNSESLIKMMESNVNPNIGRNIDAKV